MRVVDTRTALPPLIVSLQRPAPSRLARSAASV